MAHACNPRTLGGQGRRIAGTWKVEVAASQDRTTVLQPGETEQDSILKKIKISQAWYQEPAIPATQEAEVGESLEPQRWRLQAAGIAPLHSSLGFKNETPQKKQVSTY